MKLTLDVDTEKLNDDQLDKFKRFLVSIGHYPEGMELQMPSTWLDDNVTDDSKKHWWQIWKKDDNL